MNFITLSVMVLALPSVALASTVAIIDSGTDYKHEKLANQYEMNEAEVADDKTDNDGNGYVDDVHGWNFAEQNNQVIDYSYLGTFSPDTRKFFEIQTRVLEGTATETEKEWMKSKRSDETFIKELQKFGNFTHGTHVAGISAEGNPNTKVFGVKIIPTEVKLPFMVYLEKNGFFRSEMPSSAAGSLKEMIFKQGLMLLARQQGKVLIPAGSYVGLRGADVANGSFGTSYEAIKPMIEQLYNAVFKEEERDPAKVDTFVKAFLGAVVSEMTQFVKASPKTLFVFAAGNDGTNNDELPVSPANVKTDNAITVAATLKDGALAGFSNFGEEMVEVAAPGVGILSTIPGNEMMVMSGTSQAAPHVSNIAAEMKNLNPALKPYELKTLLMATVDKKSWLAGKVKTGGMVNAERAFHAAKASVSTDIHSAIAESFKAVQPAVESAFAPRMNIRQPSAKEAMVLPLPSLFHSVE